MEPTNLKHKRTYRLVNQPSYKIIEDENLCAHKTLLKTLDSKEIKAYVKDFSRGKLKSLSIVSYTEHTLSVWPLNLWLLVNGK